MSDFLVDLVFIPLQPKVSKFHPFRKKKLRGKARKSKVPHCYASLHQE
ncbi:MAG TPA: hypothetical protein VFM25_01520 [Verrucomicrobiae bacterium]|jgi:hypothetical protein|nr:hypothetical protein [Verrucomicrobiae bacterium]